VLNNSNNRNGFAAGLAGLAVSLALTMTFAASAAHAQTPAAAAPAATSPARASGSTTTLPQVNVVASKPEQKPVDAQAVPGGSAMPVRDAVVNAYLKVHREPIKMPVTQTGCKAAMAPGKPYFVEFRSRGAQSYGHTFVFFGRLGAGNRFASYSVAGLHPAGEEASTYIQGHWSPVPAETGVSWGDLDEQYLTARFCVTLNEAEYKKVVAVIRNLQATKKTWHAGTYNCNSFGADIAKAAGLDTPNPNMYLPERFINRLAEDNPRKKADGGSVFSNWMQQQQSKQR
jgi:hypothetical protein